MGKKWVDIFTQVRINLPNNKLINWREDCSFLIKHDAPTHGSVTVSCGVTRTIKTRILPNKKYFKRPGYSSLMVNSFTTIWLY